MYCVLKSMSRPTSDSDCDNVHCALSPSYSLASLRLRVEPGPVIILLSHKKALSEYASSKLWVKGL